MVSEPRGAAEAESIHSEHAYRLLIEQVQDHAIFLTDRQGAPVSWNEGVKRVLGYERDEFLGLSPTNLYTREDAAAGTPQHELEEASKTGRASNDRWMRRKDGTHFWASGATTSLWDRRGHLIGFGKVMRDLTEQKRYEQALEGTVSELERSRADLEEKNKELELLAESVVGRELKMIELERELDGLRQLLNRGQSESRSG